ncbi:unnamed protein product [Triticum turgidum subsp. durum]|uniref:non-specific serine/threonine protein kinase n=1 Tax=Triticum turgidum subsp. durum TaxID=4567 RepID=A0A9R1BC30_TRITD|nr:unnamed protein product [Triticum turgidum subsp. durum]
MEVVDKIAEPEGPSVTTAQQPNNLELPASVVIDAAREGEGTQQRDEKDPSAEGGESFRFRGEESSDEGGRSSFSGASHPPEPIDVDLMSTLYVSVDEKPGPPGCLLRGLSAKGPSMEDIAVHATDVVALVEEMKVPGAPVPEPPGEAVPSTQSSSEKDRVWGASLPPSGNGSPHSGSDSAGAVAATGIRNSLTSTSRSGSIASEPVVTAGRTQDSAKGSFRGSSMESIKTSASQASDGSDDSGCSNNITGAASKPHKGNDPRWRAILAVRARGGALGMSHFRLLRRLGCGDIGSVYLSELSGTRCHFAMKVMDKASLASRKKLSRARTEREILQLLDHPFLPTLYTHFETDRFSCLVMEFCPGGDLHALRQPARAAAAPAPETLLRVRGEVIIRVPVNIHLL